MIASKPASASVCAWPKRIQFMSALEKSPCSSSTGRPSPIRWTASFTASKLATRVILALLTRILASVPALPFAGLLCARSLFASATSYNGLPSRATGTELSVAEADPIVVKDEAAAAGKTPRSWRRIALMAALPVLLIAASVGYWLSIQGQVSTDNAYIQQDMVAISAEVGGEIVDVQEKEEQVVEQGQ